MCVIQSNVRETEIKRKRDREIQKETEINAQRDRREEERM